MDKLVSHFEHIRTALSNVTAINGHNTLSELPLCGKINLRGDAQNDKFCNTIKAITGLDLPIEANTTTANDDYRLFWLGPDEWMIYLSLESVTSRIAELQKGLATQHFALTEVSDYFSVIQLSGNQSREIIASGSPFDTRPDHFKSGQCAQTLFGHASVLLWPTDEHGFCLQVRWTYAQYLYAYLSQSIHNAEQVAAFET